MGFGLEDQINAGNIISFIMMCISFFSLYKTTQAAKQSRSEQELKDGFKLDALVQRFDELSASLHGLVDGYTSNEKRISLLEHNDSRQDKRLCELEERVRHIVDEVLPSMGR